MHPLVPRCTTNFPLQNKDSKVQCEILCLSGSQMRRVFPDVRNHSQMCRGSDSVANDTLLTQLPRCLADFRGLRDRSSLSSTRVVDKRTIVTNSNRVYTCNKWTICYI